MARKTSKRSTPALRFTSARSTDFSFLSLCAHIRLASPSTAFYLDQKHPRTGCFVIYTSLHAVSPDAAFYISAEQHINVSPVVCNTSGRSAQHCVSAQPEAPNARLSRYLQQFQAASHDIASYFDQKHPRHVLCVIYKTSDRSPRQHVLPRPEAHKGRVLRYLQNIQAIGPSIAFYFDQKHPSNVLCVIYTTSTVYAAALRST